MSDNGIGLETLKEKVGICIRKHPDWNATRVAHASGASMRVVREVMVDELVGEMPDVERVEEKPKERIAKSKRQQIGISLEEFMVERDPLTKARKQMQEAVAMLEHNKGRFVKNTELRREVGCGDSVLWREIAIDESEGFTENQFVWKEEHWWSDRESVAEMLKSRKKAKAVGKTVGKSGGQR